MVKIRKVSESFGLHKATKVLCVDQKCTSDWFVMTLLAQCLQNCQESKLLVMKTFCNTFSRVGIDVKK